MNNYALFSVVMPPGIAESGVDAKYRIQDGTVQVNGKTELQRGKKLFAGDVVVCGNVTVKVVE